MKPTPLLDFWQKPENAGDPLAVFATTFALEPDFFEQDCLARFLEVSSVNEDTGSVDDIVAAVELHELLQKCTVTVLADRSAPVQRTSLLWDLLGCHVNGGLLHSKVVVLLWENATRVVVGSANLTSAGYRRQIEAALAVDLGPGCLLPPDVLNEIADELESYLRLIPGYTQDSAVMNRATATLDLFRRRLAQSMATRSACRVALAPTNPRTGPLDRWEAVWKGPQPLRATHLSPFWDTLDPAVLKAARGLLTGRPATTRAQRVAVVLGARGETSFSQTLAENVSSVHMLKPIDAEPRRLHAKCLLLESEEWVAALVGSSNHTLAGLGLSRRRHRELNVWIGATKRSKEGRSLLALIQLGDLVPVDADEVDPRDEDESELPALPTCFGLCRVVRQGEKGPWQLHLGITRHDMPDDWTISVAGDESILTREQWESAGQREEAILGLAQESLPMYVVVRWGGNTAPWAVLVDDRFTLPPGPELANLRAQHLLNALATGHSLAAVLREELENRVAAASLGESIILDPLRRFDDSASLLRRGRALAASLSAMQRRLEVQVATTDVLRARLAGPLGPGFVATKVAEALETGDMRREEAIFTVAEIALVVGRVDWSRVVQHIDRDQGLALVEQSLARLAGLLARMGDQPHDIASYARRSIKEARRCLNS